MNIYELTQALRRNRLGLTIALLLLVIAVLVLSFTVEDGKPTWRLGPKYEATLQLAVLPSYVESLTAANIGPGSFGESMEFFASMLRSAEAFVYVEESGIELLDPIRVNTSDRAPYFELMVTAGTPQEAVTAATTAAGWLEDRLKSPLRLFDLPSAPEPLETIDLTVPFSSAVVVESVVDPDNAQAGQLFLEVDSGLSERVVVPIVRRISQQAPPAPVTLLPSGSLLLSLQDDVGETLDTMRLSLPPLPGSSTRAPYLTISVDTTGIVQNADGEYSVPFNWASMLWIDGPPVAAEEFDPVRDISVVVLTEEPVAVPTGERRGPILLVAALTVGVIVILSVVITLDTWRMERMAATGEPGRLRPMPLPEVDRDEAAEA